MKYKKIFPLPKNVKRVWWQENYENDKVQITNPISIMLERVSESLIKIQLENNFHFIFCLKWNKDILKLFT